MEDKGKSEQEKRIETAIIAAFDKYSIRYFERLYNDIQTANHEEKVELLESSRREDLLLLKRVLAPGFFRYVLGSIMRDRKFERQRTTLIRAFLISIFDPDGVKIDELVEHPEKELNISEKRPLPERYTRRHVQRLLHVYFQDAFFEAEAFLDKRKIDDRFRPKSSVFADGDLPIVSTSNLAKEVVSAASENTRSDNDQMRLIYVNSQLQSIMPEVLKDMLSFAEECGEVVAREGFETREKYSIFFSSKPGDYSRSFIVFYNHLSSILAWEWFRSRRPEGQKKLLNQDFSFNYPPSDAHKARELLLELTCSEKRTDYILNFGAIALQKIGQTENSVVLLKESLKLTGLSSLDQGINTENIAIAYRELKKYKLMVGYVKKALKQYEAAGELYRVCVGLKNIGEAEWYMGFRENAWKFFGEAEKRSKILTDPMQRFGVMWNLAVAFRRIGDVKTEINYLKKCLETVPDTETEKIIEIEARLEQLDKFF